MKRSSVGAKDRTNETKTPQKPFASIFHSRRGNERQNDTQSQTEDKEMTDEEISLPPWPTDRNTFTRTAITATPEFNGSSDVTEDPVADIIKSLNEFIASVTIPPPPPPLPSPPPPLRGSQLVPRSPKCLHARDVISGRNYFPQQNFGLDAGYDRNRNNNLLQSVVQRQQDRTIFSDGRSDSKQSINPLPQQQPSENFSSPSEVDFSKLIIPPPPPLNAPSPKSILKIRESGTFYSDHDYRLNSTTVTTTAQRPKLPPPLPPLLTPPPLVRQLPSLPPLHPSRSRLAGRSPSLHPRASSAGRSPGRGAPSPRAPPFEKLPFGFSDDPAFAADSRGPGDDDVCADSKQTDEIVNDRRNGERDSSSEKKQINRQNSEYSSTGAAAAAAALQRRIIVEPRAVTLSRAYNSVGTFSRATPPVLPSPRLSSSVNCSPVAKRSVRRVSFNQCPPSTLCLPPSDKECDKRQKQKSHRNETNYSPFTSFRKSLDVATDRTEGGQEPATAQIRPNALRSTTSLGFHGVVVRGSGEGPPCGKAVSSAGGYGGRVARSGSVDSAPSRTAASVFAAIRSKLKSYWSPSTPRRKTSLPVNNDRSKTALVASEKTSVELERVEGNPPKGRNSNWRRGGRDSSKERSYANVDSRSIVNRSSSTDVEDDSLEFYRELKQTIPKTFKTFNGKRI